MPPHDHHAFHAPIAQISCTILFFSFASLWIARLRSDAIHRRASAAALVASVANLGYRVEYDGRTMIVTHPKTNTVLVTLSVANVDMAELAVELDLEDLRLRMSGAGS